MFLIQFSHGWLRVQGPSPSNVSGQLIIRLLSVGTPCLILFSRFYNAKLAQNFSPQKRFVNVSDKSACRFCPGRVAGSIPEARFRAVPGRITSAKNPDVNVELQSHKSFDFTNDKVALTDVSFDLPKTFCAFYGRGRRKP